MNSSELNQHMLDFDNLGFTNPNVYLWHKDILTALESEGFVMSDFYYTKNNINNKKLLERIAIRAETFYFLEKKGLLNRGFCPITGEKINNTNNYSIYDRKIYLSIEGLKKCDDINRSNWKGTQMDYDQFKTLKNSNNQNSGCLSVVIILVASISLMFYLIS